MWLMSSIITSPTTTSQALLSQRDDLTLATIKTCTERKRLAIKVNSCPAPIESYNRLLQVYIIAI